MTLCLYYVQEAIRNSARLFFYCAIHIDCIATSTGVAFHTENARKDAYAASATVIGNSYGSGVSGRYRSTRIVGNGASAVREHSLYHQWSRTSVDKAYFSSIFFPLTYFAQVKSRAIGKCYLGVGYCVCFNNRFAAIGQQGYDSEHYTDYKSHFTINLRVTLPDLSQASTICIPESRSKVSTASSVL